MKQKLLKLALCAMALLPLGAWADVDFGTEEVVDGVDGIKTWVFSDETAYPSTLTKSVQLNDKLYMRSAKSSRGFTFGTTDETGKLKFSNDNAEFTVTRMGTTSNMGNVYSEKISTAGQTTLSEEDVINQVTPFFAFNAAVPGTVYVLMKGNAGVYDEGTSTWTTKYSKLRIYFVDATAETVSTVGASETKKRDIQATGVVQEIKWTSSKAGSFFIGSMDNTCQIYAIRFVPLYGEVSIGETGYATYGNTVGKHLVIPDGLTVYKATANTNSVTISPVSGIRMGEGYVVKGTVGKTYTLFATATDPGKSNKGGDMVRVDSDIKNFAATENDKYRYILGSDGGTAKFFVPSGSGTLAAGKAYLQTTNDLTSSGARSVSIEFADGTTNIDIIESQKEINDGKWYNMQGVEVKSPSKGLYIRNGKKVIIK